MALSYLLLMASLLSIAFAKQLPCKADAIPIPEYFGTEVTSLTAVKVRNFTDFPLFDFSLLQYPKDPLNFCNVTITYAHPGVGDSVNVYVWLPLDNWNGKFFGQGGGGWAAGVNGNLEEYSSHSSC